MSLAEERRIQDSAQRLQVTLEQELDLPASVVRVLVTRDVDASGDDALWAWIIARDEVEEDLGAYAEVLSDLEGQVTEIAAREVPEHWTYVRVTTESFMPDRG